MKGARNGILCKHDAEIGEKFHPMGSHHRLFLGNSGAGPGSDRRHYFTHRGYIGPKRIATVCRDGNWWNEFQRHMVREPRRIGNINGGGSLHRAGGHHRHAKRDSDGHERGRRLEIRKCDSYAEPAAGGCDCFSWYSESLAGGHTAV